MHMAFKLVIVVVVNVHRKMMRSMMLSGGWDELLLLPEMDIDKALNAARTAGDYPMPGEE